MRNKEGTSIVLLVEEGEGMGPSAGGGRKRRTRQAASNRSFVDGVKNGSGVLPEIYRGPRGSGREGRPMTCRGVHRP